KNRNVRPVWMERTIFICPERYTFPDKLKSQFVEINYITHSSHIQPDFHCVSSKNVRSELYTQPDSARKKEEYNVCTQRNCCPCCCRRLPPSRCWQAVAAGGTIPGKPSRPPTRRRGKLCGSNSRSTRSSPMPSTMRWRKTSSRLTSKKPCSPTQA